ncbi:probable conserved hypothetical Ustilaginaceae-specific protein [Ustilago trichophora]|uniref:Probable conserved hypothetical Ustilaginaceae-specific protein n=1 Tax=Ustilago trichophora TaxID=86804 RepID=A0A5C3E2N0_9BASI|nr:probable conserved hypothetical Ustilaginaceae-specific protein [Ustilago trichophora]
MPPKGKSSRLDSAHSASPVSAASPPRHFGTMRDSSSTSLSSLPQIEVKPQKACVLCRRSKVKCIHDGAPPCKRCKDTNQEAQCKFRLRADDETWRERTDEVLSKLGKSVEWLVQQQQQQQQQQQIDHRHSDTAASSSSPMSAPSPRKSHPNPGLYRPSLAPARPSGVNAWQAQPHPQVAQHDPVAPHSDPLLHHSATTAHGRPSSTTYLGFDGAAGLLSPGDSHVRSVSSPSSSAANSAHRHYRSPPSASQSFRPLHNPHLPPPPLPPPTAHLPPFDNSTAMPTAVSAPHLASSHRAAGAASLPAPNTRRLPPDHYSQHIPALEPGQSGPSSIIYAAQQPYSNAGESSRTQTSISRASTASPYGRPSHCIGRNDPRLTVISMGLVSMDQARHLFKFFARYLQPHCFGFPAYPANEHMTPLIIACILMVSSMHEPNSRHLFERLRHEAFSSPLLLDHPIDRHAPLDPELGIGVEEITGACIAACWLGGQTALSIARLARYWAIGYLEHFEVRSAQTLGEWMTILPPFRQIDLVGKLRIWLMSYITEAQQAVINDKPSLFPESQPAHYCQGLLNASSHSAEFAETFAQNDGVKKSAEALNAVDGTPNSTHSNSSAAPPPPSDGAGGIGSFASDRQLVAHARMMSILLAAQDLHRSARAAVASAKPTPSEQQSTHSTASRTRQENRLFEPSHMAERWREWMEELNRWRLLTSQHSDLSDSSLELIDLSLLYHLSRTFLASHPLDPKLGILDETQHALRAASNANPPDLSRLAIAQLRTISTAKHSALFALKLATTEFGERLSYLPQFYHWLLGHAAGLLLLLIQRRETFLMAKEAESLLEVTEKFVQLYVFRVTSHSFHSAAADYSTSSTAQRTGIKRSASDADLRDSNGEDSERRKHAGASIAEPDRGSNGNSDPLSFQWPFMSGFPTTQASGAALAPDGPAAATLNPIAQQQLAHGNPAEKHPALANAQALARALYLVKMQVQSLDVQL